MFTLKSIKHLVLAQLSIDPTISLKSCQLVVPGLKKDNFYKIKRERNKPNKQSKQKNKPRGSTQRDKANDIPPDTPSHPHLKIIDDPDELLYSVAIRELNKTTPDPRWATILIQCRKEIGKRTGEVLDQLQKLPTKALVEMLKKESGKSSHVEQ